MFVVLLRFAQHRERAPEFMAAHNQWLKKGFDDGVFLVAGSLQPGLGGSVVAHGITHEELENRVNLDPFVEHGVVSTEILEISPKKTDERLAFLLD